MNYLFFDVECANSFDGVGKICEFGYVLTDENLNIIKQGIYLINPDAEFDWYVKYKIISYAIKEYEKAPKYNLNTVKQKIFLFCSRSNVVLRMQQCDRPGYGC